MREPIRIAYLVRPVEGGIRVHLLTLLSGLDRSKFEPVVICPASIPLFQEVSRMGIRTIPLDIVGELKPSQDLASILRLRSILRRVRPDILHMHSSKAGLIGRLAALTLMRRPRLVLTEHSFIFDERTTGRRRALIAAVERMLSRATARIIAVSDALRDELVSEERIEPSRITTVHNGITFSESPGQPPSDILIGTISRLAPQKGVDHFINAAALVARRFPGARFAIIGDGPHREALESLARSLSIQDKLEFMGYRSDILSVVRTFSVFVLASMRETFGLTLVEAMSQGVPVVASRTGGIPEIVDGSSNGLLADPGNPEQLASQICRLLEDRDLARRIGEEGVRSVRTRFSSEAMVDKTQRVYLEVIDNHRI